MSAIASLLLPMAVVIDLHNSPIQFETHDCLIENVLHEARGETIEGQLAVLEVVYERVVRSDYPNRVCEVVYQPYQFSWTNDRHPVGEPTEQERLQVTQLVYSYIYGDGLPHSDVYGATHYLNPSKLDRLPSWVNEYELVGKIGNHEFYKSNSNVRRNVANLTMSW